MNRVEIALRFVLSQQQISSALVGVHSIDELEASLQIAEKEPLLDDIMKQLHKLRWDDPEMLNPGTWGTALVSCEEFEYLEVGRKYS